MDLETFRQYCLGKLAATEGTPFGEDVLVFKVAGKIFALAPLDEVPATANLKCNRILLSNYAIDTSRCVRLSHEQKTLEHSRARHGIPDTELRKMIDHSYGCVKVCRKGEKLL
jgi:predicted DNA-binding protein (MmcQ/YjbR family)